MEQTGLTLHFDPSRYEHRGVYAQDQGNNPHGSHTLLWQREQGGEEWQTVYLFILRS